jgi:hypothetical protein
VKVATLPHHVLNFRMFGTSSDTICEDCLGSGKILQVTFFISTIIEMLEFLVTFHAYRRFHIKILIRYLVQIYGVSRLFQSFSNTLRVLFITLMFQAENRNFL